MSLYDYVSYESWGKLKQSTNIIFFNTTINLDNKIKDNKLVEQVLQRDLVTSARECVFLLLR